MSEDFSLKENTSITALNDNSEETINYFHNIINNGQNLDELNLPYDHMYATNTTDSNDVVNNLTVDNCQTAESEVKFLKEWLILHLDLIQQQNDEILNKERTILILQQENEMLKERISCMERGAPFESNKYFENHVIKQFQEDMTQDSVVGPCDEDNKHCLNLLNENDAALNNFEQNHKSEDIQTDNCQSQTDINCVNNTTLLKTESDNLDFHNSSEFDFTISNHNYNTSDLDSMKNLRMSIRRKRVCSNSSALSNNDSAVEEKRSYRRFRKKRKRVVKESQLITTPEHYITQTGEKANQNATEILTNDTNLEVPRWRVKVYASCYTMEGTENLDDEVYNKRHSRLEIDERRRKRWDVQRIREQRVIEKLKQRQERIGSGSRIDQDNENVQSLWPKIDDIKYLEISEQLPVSAFGCPIPKICSSEFSLPWLNNPSLLITTSKRIPGKKSNVKRKHLKR